MKLQGVNTLVFIDLATVLKTCRFEFWVQPKVLGVNTLDSTKLVGVMSYKCWGLCSTIIRHMEVLGLFK